MKPSYLMIYSGVVYAVLGVALLLANGVVLALYGGMSMEPLTDHLLGAGLISFAVLNYFAIREPTLQASQSVLVPNLAFNTLGFVVILLQMLSGGPNALGWITVANSLFLALGFAYVLFMSPRISSRASVS